MFRLLKWFLMFVIVLIGVMIYILVKDVQENPDGLKEELHELLDGNSEPLRKTIEDTAKDTASSGKEKARKSLKDIADNFFGG